jgi:nucleotide-binding universal stress UspA family protein
MGYRTILVGTDGSDTATRAIDKAVRLARQVGGRVVIACATAPVGLHDYRAMEILKEAEEHVRPSGVPAETTYREGHPDKVLLDLAAEQDADLILVGNVGMGKAKRFRIGPIPERIASAAPCDVLIVSTAEGESPPADEHVYHRILVGTDGSPTASEAARKAFDLGMTFEIGCSLIYVAGDTIVGAIVLEQTLKAKPRGLRVESKILEGDAAEKICEHARAEGFDLIVVGNRGMTGVRRHLLGSVPTRVVHFAAGDVLIAKTVDRTIEDLAPGTGGLVEADGKTVAAFKAEDGSVIALSPRCSHLGCTVDWNATAKTWDCPCHGSRYSRDGDLLQGPAKTGLERETIG